MRTHSWDTVEPAFKLRLALLDTNFHLYAEYIMRNAGLEEAKLESRLPREISITSDMQMTPPLWQKVKRN